MALVHFVFSWKHSSRTASRRAAGVADGEKLVSSSSVKTDTSPTSGEESWRKAFVASALNETSFSA